MKRVAMTSIAAAVVFVSTASAASADKSQDIMSSGTIRIGIPADLPPFGYQNANREAEEFDIDLTKVFAASLGMKAEFVPLTGSNRIPLLLTDKVDTTISLMGLSPARAKQD